MATATDTTTSKNIRDPNGVCNQSNSTTPEREHAYNITKYKQLTVDRYMRKTKVRPLAQQEVNTLSPIKTQHKTPTNPLTRPRGAKRDHLTHVIPYPSHLPPVPADQQQRPYVTYNWHLKMNHTNLQTLQTMARLPEQLGIPAVLRRTPPPINCHGCIMGHFQKARRKNIRNIPPPGHTITKDLAGPLLKIAAGQEATDFINEAVDKMERCFGHPASQLRCDNAN